MKKYIIDEFKKINMDISDYQANQFYRYYELLSEKNKVMNLTAITEFPEVVEKHFLDSCIYSNEFIHGDGSGIKLIDVGTGAGFPGIPLKILYPSLDVTLLDSLNKRLVFLETVIEELGLKGISTVHYRAEDGGRDKAYREQFDIAVARAVANLSSLAEYCMPFVKVGGIFAAYKAEASEEIQAAKNAVSILGGEISKIIECRLPNTGGVRQIAVVCKKKSTPGKYPRKAGVPSKNPL